MSNPIRSRNRTAVVFGVSLAVFLPALIVPRSAEHLPLRTMLLVASMAAMLFSAVWLIVRWDEARRLTRLRAGQGVLARWSIDAAQWQAFRRHSAAWDQREGLRPNDADLAQDPGPAGIEIVVARDGILIGQDFHPLEKDVRITVHPNWMEFHQVIPKPNGPALHTVLRLPLRPGQELLGREVEQACRHAYTVAAGVGRRALLALGLGLIVGMPAVAALAWFVARITGWVE